MITKFVWRKYDGEVHVDVYSSYGKECAFGQNGCLIFSEKEWKALYACLRRGSEDYEEDSIMVVPWELRNNY